MSFRYGKEDEKLTIDNISFKIEGGQSIGIVGHTGSGKSTIVRLLYRFYDIIGGRILINGQDITQMKIKDLRSLIAIVP